MGVAMAKPSVDVKADEGGEPESTLKCDRSDARLVSKIAAMREKTVKELFREKDVREFWHHLLLAEMDKEAQRIRGPKKS